MSMTRRTFLGASAAPTPRPAFSQDKKGVCPKEEGTVALLGCGGMGRGNLADFVRLPDFECVALCDPDPRQIQAGMEDLKKKGRPTEKVQVEKDFRKVIERKDLDAVIVG